MKTGIRVEDIRTISDGGFCSTDSHVFPLNTNEDQPVLIIQNKHISIALDVKDDSQHEEAEDG